MTLEYHVSLSSTLPPEQIESSVDMLEEATMQVLNDLDNQDWCTDSPSDVQIVWNGTFSFQRSMAEPGQGSNWLQILRFLLYFEVDVLDE
jgi:hypothetical protein